MPDESTKQFDRDSLDQAHSSTEDTPLIPEAPFYQELQPFRKEYNNYRDDHALLRNLTRADGVMISCVDHVEVHLFPTAHHPPARRNLIEDLFDRINSDSPRMPDGSGRQIAFKLGDKAGIELAKAKLSLTPNY